MAESSESALREGSPVKWKWGNGWGKGKIAERFTRNVTRTLSGNEVTREGSEENPAYLIRQDDGGEVLKLKSEIQRDD